MCGIEKIDIRKDVLADEVATIKNASEKSDGFEINLNLAGSNPVVVPDGTAINPNQNQWGQLRNENFKKYGWILGAFAIVVVLVVIVSKRNT